MILQDRDTETLFCQGPESGAFEVKAWGPRMIFDAGAWFRFRFRVSSLGLEPTLNSSDTSCRGYVFRLEEQHRGLQVRVFGRRDDRFGPRSAESAKEQRVEPVCGGATSEHPEAVEPNVGA